MDIKTLALKLIGRIVSLLEDLSNVKEEWFDTLPLDFDLPGFLKKAKGGSISKQILLDYSYTEGITVETDQLTYRIYGLAALMKIYNLKLKESDDEEETDEGTEEKNREETSKDEAPVKINRENWGPVRSMKGVPDRLTRNDGSLRERENATKATKKVIFSNIWLESYADEFDLKNKDLRTVFLKMLENPRTEWMNYMSEALEKLGISVKCLTISVSDYANLKNTPDYKGKRSRA